MTAHSPLSFAEFDRLARQADLVPVWWDMLADTETPVSAFLKLPDPSRAFLLESVEGGERWGRYSFLADRPLSHVRLQGTRAVIEKGGSSIEVEQERPLQSLRTLLQGRRLARPAGLPPFIGGLVGYLSYSAVRWFEPRVPQRHGPDPAFPDGEWMLVDRLIAFDNLSHRLKLISLADLPAYPSARAAYDAALQNIDELREALSRPLPPPGEAPRLSEVREAWSHDGFTEAVRRIREYIRAGDCMQVVVSRRVLARYQGEPFELYRRLRASAPTPFLFYLRFGERAITGASPELMVRLQEGTVTLRPIAGTRPRGSSPAEDRELERELRGDPKELAEHVMLLDLGRNDIGRVAAPGTVKVEEREVIERYSHVMHLVSQVSGRLKPGLDAIDAIAATFPAGTVSGAPKVRAMEIIDELEPMPRGPYAGAVGYLGFDGRMDLAISIRTLALAGEELRFQAGAGIVFDSDPEREHEETAHKMRSTLAVLEGDEPSLNVTTRARR